MPNGTRFARETTLCMSIEHDELFDVTNSRYEKTKASRKLIFHPWPAKEVPVEFYRYNLTVCMCSLCGTSIPRRQVIRTRRMYKKKPGKFVEQEHQIPAYDFNKIKGLPGRMQLSQSWVMKCGCDLLQILRKAGKLGARLD